MHCKTLYGRIASLTEFTQSVEWYDSMVQPLGCLHWLHPLYLFKPVHRDGGDPGDLVVGTPDQQITLLFLNS